MMSPAGAFHGDVANTLAFMLTGHVKKHNLGKVFAAETGFILSRNPDTVRAPDVAFVRSDRVRAIPKEGFFQGAPDLAVFHGASTGLLDEDDITSAGEGMQSGSAAVRVP